MFVVSKKNFIFRLPDGEFYKLKKDYMGEAPDYLADLPLFKLAVQGGDIMTPATTAERDIYKADEKAAGAALKSDIRPDAPKVDKSTTEAVKPVKRASKRVKS
jgi:hypothetical protein